MTEEQRHFFEALTECREKDADALDRPNLRGVKKSIVDKYSDQAHFVYELIQNADDAGATEATFDVQDDRLVFRHNGTRRFEVTNPETEGEDYDNHTLGDVNAITGIGLSSKPEENKKGNSIGKFGMGFKSIFQYTNTPEIYDPNVAFRIERQIVPRQMEHDYPGRKQNETLFVFPFDNAEARRPASDSLEKLNALVLPTLFLNNLENLTFSHGEDFGEYRRRTEREETFGEGYAFTHCELVEYSSTTTSSGTKKERIWLFTRKDAQMHRYSVGFLLGPEGNLIPADYKAFCFFPTKHETKLKFLIHAPFLLTDSRETIKEFEDHNRDMVKKLACLASDGLLFLRNLEPENGKRLIDDNVLDVLPIESCSLNDRFLTIEGVDEDRRGFFAPFYKSVSHCFREKEILPTTSGYARSENAYWPVSKSQVQIFPDSILQELFQQEGIHWAFVTRYSESVSEAHVSKFILNCTAARLTEISLLDRISSEFITSRTPEWRSRFYRWIDESGDRRKKARRLPIFINQRGGAVPAFDDRDKHCLFLPVGSDGNFNTVHPELLKDEGAKALIASYEIGKPDPEAHVRWIIENRLSTAEGVESDQLLKTVFAYYFTLGGEERDNLAEDLRQIARFRCTNCSETGEMKMSLAGELYLPNDDLRVFFSNCRSLFFLDCDHYYSLIDPKFKLDLDEFWSKIGVARVPRIRNVSISSQEAWSI